MGTPLRVLLVEDSESDARLIVLELEEEYDVQFQRVVEPEAYRAALDEPVWDVIISDYFMPKFDGLEALAMMRESGLDLPFIIVSGVIGEDVAVEAMRGGAYDYVMKRDLVRLGSAVRRALQESKTRRAREEAEEALRQSRERLRRAVEDAPFPIMLHAEGGEVLRINEVWTELTGYTPDEIPTIEAWTERAYGEAKSQVQAGIDKLYDLDRRVSEGEFVITTRSGEKRTWQFSSAPLGWLPDGRRLVISMAMDITKRKQADEEIAALAKFPNENPYPVLRIDDEGVIIYANKASQPLLDLWACQVGQQLPEDWCRFTKDVLRDGAIEEVEVEVDDRTFSLSWAPMVDEEYVNIYGLDITERKRAQEQVLKLSQAVEQSPNTVVITDVDGNIEYANPKFTQITGYQVEEVLGENPRILKSGEQPASFYEEMWRTIIAGDEWRGEFANKKKDGELYWELASISPVRNAEGEVVSFVKAAEDITERKRAEEALRRHAAEMEARNQELDAFAHTVAHDLQNPLGIVIGYAEALELDGVGLSDELRNYVHAIARNGRLMSKIIDELLLLAGVRQMEVEASPIKMVGIVAEVQQRLADMIEETQAEIVLPKSWPVALGYGPWIAEAWANYISNAIKYGGEPPRVELGATEQKDGMVRFWVRDNGPGLTEEEQARLFTPFTRMAQARAKGHGLGLSIVRRIVEKLGGQVGVESQVGKGSVFFFTLTAK